MKKTGRLTGYVYNWCAWNNGNWVLSGASVSRVYLWVAVFSYINTAVGE